MSPKTRSSKGFIAVADTIRPGSAEAVQKLHSMGIKVVMLTGDNERTANAIGRQAGVDQIVAEVMPRDKVRHVKSIQAEGYVVAMVGDGVNDAPALAQADVGIAIGSGTDIAMEVCGHYAARRCVDLVKSIRLSRQHSGLSNRISSGRSFIIPPQSRLLPSVF